jgi:hypothetical protein
LPWYGDALLEAPNERPNQLSSGTSAKAVEQASYFFMLVMLEPKRK